VRQEKEVVRQKVRYLEAVLSNESGNTGKTPKKN
jgi:hypothetical protein